MKKIVLVGTGSVGMSFIYAMINQGVQANYILIDIFKDAALGQGLDVSDAIAALSRNGSKIKVGEYAECADADLVVITAGRPQKSAEESRLEMVGDNARIIAEIGKNIKENNFNGVTIIASNPCDVLATVYQKTTGFNEKKVFSSGTFIDTTRMKHILGSKLKVNPDAIAGFVLGEHGDNSVPVYSSMQIGGVSLNQFVAAKKITPKDLENLHKQVVDRAYEIIRLKRVTCYGIGVCLSVLANAVLNDTNDIFPVGIKLDKSFATSGIYLSYPARLSAAGWSKVEQIKWNETEEKTFNEACQRISEVCAHALKAAKSVNKIL